MCVFSNKAVEKSKESPYFGYVGTKSKLFIYL